MAGEVWRLVSFVFIPQVSLGGQLSVVWEFFYLNFLWLMGEGLEQAWGSFKLNLFYLLGMVGTSVAAFCFDAVDANGVFLNLSLFFAFATLFPSYPVLLFFVLPIRVKWIAIASSVLVLLQFVAGPSTTRLTIGVSLLNYAVFFGPEWLAYWRQNSPVARRQQQFRVAQQAERSRRFTIARSAAAPRRPAPISSFRVAGDGEEYCLAHLPSRRAAEEVPPPLPR